MSIPQVTPLNANTDIQTHLAPRIFQFRARSLHIASETHKCPSAVGPSKCSNTEAFVFCVNHPVTCHCKKKMCYAANVEKGALFNKRLCNCVCFDISFHRHCNTIQHIATHCNNTQFIVIPNLMSALGAPVVCIIE